MVTKSTAAPLLLAWSRNSGTHAAPAVDGPPTRSLGSIAFDRLCRDVIKFEIGLLVSALEETRQIGLVPDLEVPASDLFDAVALAQMRDERRDEVRPAVQPRMRRVAVPMEDLVLGCLQRLGREAQLDERLDLLRQQSVVQLVDLGPIVDRLAVLHPHGAEHVVENGVETDVPKSEFVDRNLQLRLAVVTDEGAGIVRSRPNDRKSGRSACPASPGR